MIKNHLMKIALVTGANKGIGYEVARQLARQGARIIVRLATLPGNGPTGGFFNEEGTIPW